MLSASIRSAAHLRAPTPRKLESLETSFQQDLNGDGTDRHSSRRHGTTIEAFGATKLVQVGNDYFLNPVSGGTGPELMYGGAAPWARAEGVWLPIGAETDVKQTTRWRC